VIRALAIKNSLRGFGISFSKSLDLDGNGLRDLVVGKALLCTCLTSDSELSRRLRRHHDMGLWVNLYFMTGVLPRWTI
jgi:hypothetical protein